MAAPIGRPELADIVRTHGKALGDPPAHERRVLDALQSCRTAVLGGHVRACGQCGHREISYNSCRDRHCPKCQALDRVRWRETRAEDLLPVPYFHRVSTLPAALHDLFLGHARVAHHCEPHHKHPTLLFGVSSPLWDYVFGAGRPRS